jgi:hypothetical protein
LLKLKESVLNGNEKIKENSIINEFIDKNPLLKSLIQ